MIISDYVRPARKVICICLVLLAGAALTGCPKPEMEPEYARPLPRGHALRKITDPKDMPDLSEALWGADDALLKTLDNSIGWFTKPSSRQFFPADGVTFDQADASIYAFRTMLAASKTKSAFKQSFNEDFDVYESIGWDGSGVVLFTGYYSPVLKASKVRTAEFQYPLYSRPADLVSDPVTGEVKGRNVGGQIVPYPTRAQIEDGHLLDGQEFVWLADKLDCYIVQIQGSAKLNMTDGSTLLIGYAGNNGHAYTSIARMLASDGKIDKNKLSLPLLRDYFRAHPDELDKYTRMNDRFVFFKRYDESNWPAGSLGVEVTPMRSLATDKSIFPRGMATLVVTKIPDAGAGDGTRVFRQFMADQDTGGAIRAPGWADIYMGAGPDAEQVAGRQVYEGRLYYFILKPEQVAPWLARMKGTTVSLAR